MLRLIVPILLLAPSIRADVTAMVLGEQNTGFTPSCSATSTGTISAFASISCEVNGTSLSGSAGVQLGLGPYGIGISTTTHANGAGNLDHLLPQMVSSVEFNWSQSFIITGADGDGLVRPRPALASRRIDGHVVSY